MVRRHIQIGSVLRVTSTSQVAGSDHRALRGVSWLKATDACCWYFVVTRGVYGTLGSWKAALSALKDTPTSVTFFCFLGNSVPARSRPLNRCLCCDWPASGATVVERGQYKTLAAPCRGTNDLLPLLAPVAFAIQLSFCVLLVVLRRHGVQRQQ